MAESESPPDVERPLDRRVLEELERRLERNVNDRVSTTVSALRKTGGTALTEDTSPRAVTLALQRLADDSSEDPRETAGIRIDVNTAPSRNRYAAYYASPGSLARFPTGDDPLDGESVAETGATSAASADGGAEPVGSEDAGEADSGDESEADPYADTPPALDRAIREAGLGDAGQEDESA